MTATASRFCFTGGVVVVTGAASGIGRAAAELLASEQLTVVAWDVDGGGLADVATAIGDRGGRCVPVECDVADRVALAAAWEATTRVGIPRYLVNNAGPPSSAALTVGEGLVAAAASMAEVGDGWMAIAGEQAEAMALTSSIAGTWAAGGTVDWYPMAKAAIAAYGRQVAATRRGRPRANIVQPGLIATREWSASWIPTRVAR